MEAVNDAARQARLFFAEKVVPSFIAGVAGGWMRRKFMKYARRSTLDVLSSLTSNKKLIAVLTGQYGDYGLPPSRSSFAMHAMLVRHYFNGGAYPVGGSARIFEAIAPLITEAGGKILTNAEVKQVVVRNGTAVGVEMADGRVLEAKTIISGAGVPTTAPRLLSSDDAQRTGLLECLAKLNGPRHTYHSIWDSRAPAIS